MINVYQHHHQHHHHQQQQQQQQLWWQQRRRIIQKCLASERFSVVPTNGEQMRGRVLNSVFPTTPTTKPHYATKPTTPTTKLTTSQPHQLPNYQPTNQPTTKPQHATKPTNQISNCQLANQINHTNYQTTNQPTVKSKIMQLTNQPIIPKYFSGPPKLVKLANLYHWYYHLYDVSLPYY